MRSVKKKCFWNRKLCMALLCTVFLFAAGFLWLQETEAQAHVSPGYEKEDLTMLLDSGRRPEQADYQLLFRQTGLGRAAIDYLYAQGRQEELLALQERFFVDVTVECQANTIITREERIAAEQAAEPAGAGIQVMKTEEPARSVIPYLENGDILITFNCHALSWRNGHVGIVVDTEERLTLEASRLGTDSKIVSMEHWEEYPSFAVLRLKGAAKEEREMIAAYAEESLTDIPYRLEAGVADRFLVESSLEKRGPEESSSPERGPQESGSGGRSPLEGIPAGTHCAHLTWYAYEQFGYDLDSDSGVIVTPRDIYESPLLEVVQIYGMEQRSE